MVSIIFIYLSTNNIKNKIFVNLHNCLGLNDLPIISKVLPYLVLEDGIGSKCCNSQSRVKLLYCLLDIKTNSLKMCILCLLANDVFFNLLLQLLLYWFLIISIIYEDELTNPLIDLYTAFSGTLDQLNEEEKTELPNSQEYEASFKACCCNHFLNELVNTNCFFA